MDGDPPILLTGATGYIGGRLLRALEEAGRRVRCLTRRPEALRDRVAPATEVVEGDALDPESLKGRPMRRIARATSPRERASRMAVLLTVRSPSRITSWQTTS